MGAWSSGPFDNNDAADSVGELCKMTDSEFVAAVLGDALLAVRAGDGYIEAPEMSRTVAAAAIVALFGGAGLPTPPALMQSWLDAVRLVPSDQLRSEARQVFTRAFEPENNEWYELWVDAALVDEVRANLAPYSSSVA
jgi:hypothetical protein